ncbi:hypothetical protein [Chitinophaga niabensis]|uniref:Uncharacterized protein n=1 Tax=Chitinophaga niabensis TaxID=536979 RepID=A0A1N6FBH3_9BACT|nr:hypothetical protein [Chitinophaga niabensis]SIN92592.1 hypothetical protein SAMN04488055_2126 [Chitinophaga niabensis]
MKNKRTVLNSLLLHRLRRNPDVFYPPEIEKIMKYLLICILFSMPVFHASCGQNQTNVPKGNSRSETKDTITSPGRKEPNFHTRYEYTDGIGKSLIIQNSFPKAELYTDPNGKEYGRAIFWTRIINETDNPLELMIDFSGDPYEFPGSVGSSFVSSYNILLRPDTMTLDKEPLHNYGMTDLKSFLENSMHKPSSLKRTINPKGSSGFYVVRLLIQPESGWQRVKDDGNGTTRAGFSLKGQNLFYTLNGKEVSCGSINLKNLTLKDQRTTGI